MPDDKPSEAQIATLESLPAETVTLTDEHLLAKRPDGTMVTITVDGSWSEVEEAPAPEPEVIDGEAHEVPLPEGLAEHATFDELEAAKPTAIELAVDPSDPHDVYRAMDKADEALILAELQDRALDTFVYSFESGGKQQTDLTVAGVNETVRLMNERGGTQVGISEQPPVVDHETRAGEEYVRVMVYARDARSPGSGRWGTAIEPVNNTKGWDKFAFTKALNKAERNALKKQIPEDWRQYIIAQYLGTHHMQQLQQLDPRKGLGAGRVAELPPALDDERAQAIKKEIHEKFGQLRKLNPLKMPPARMQAHLARAETESHERMEMMVDSMNEWIQQEEERLAAVAAGEQQT